MTFTLFEGILFTTEPIQSSSSVSQVTVNMSRPIRGITMGTAQSVAITQANCGCKRVRPYWIINHVTRSKLNFPQELLPVILHPPLHLVLIVHTSPSSFAKDII